MAANVLAADGTFCCASYDAFVTVRPPVARFLPGIEASVTFAVRNLTNRKYAEFGGLNFAGQRGLFPQADRHYEIGVTLRAAAK